MKTVVRNIGQLVSGDIRRPLLDADSIVVRDGRIAAIGRGLEEDADTVIDARGTTVMPGLIDSHVHPVFGDFTPRQRAVDFIDSAMNGGVTTAISAGEVHLPGRPRDIVGLKALAIVAAKAYASFRPGGVKVHAGAPILELGLTEADFAEMAAAGVKLVGEIGLGSVKTGKDAAPMVRWARRHGMTVTIHTGGPSIAGSSPINADVVLEAAPDVVGHINGGTTSMTPAEIERLLPTEMALEIVQCGNMKTALHALRLATEARATHRIIIGNDAPSGPASSRSASSAR
jgi:enamidase